MGMCLVNSYSTFELLGSNTVADTASALIPWTTKHQNGM